MVSKFVSFTQSDNLPDDTGDLRCLHHMFNECCVVALPMEHY